MTTQRTAPIRVVVADDYPMVRVAVEAVCEDAEDIEVVGQAGDGEAALQVVEELRPDVLVLDLMLPKLSGFEVATRLREAPHAPLILILTVRDDPQALLEALRLEVEGYLDKTEALEHIADAIRAIADGVRLFTSDQERAAASGLGEFVKVARERARITQMLSEREQDVLALIGEGLTTRQMATRLELSERTVDSHIAKLYRKLGVSSRTQALAAARAAGLAGPGSSPN